VGSGSIVAADLDGDGLPEATAATRGVVLARRLDGALGWDTPPAGASLLHGLWDFNGDGSEELLGVGRVVVLFDGRTGLPLWTFEHPNPDRVLVQASVIPINVDGDAEPELLIGYGPEPSIRLIDFSDGFDFATQRWSNTAPTLPSRISRFVLGDFDGDGVAAELGTVSQSYCEVTFIDVRTGATLLATGPSAHGEYCYGQMQAANIDGDPQDELIFSDDNGLANTVSVFDLVEGGPQWQYHFRLRDMGTTVFTASRMGVDLDGQAPREVVASVYDDVEEQSDSLDDGVNAPGVWTTLVLDGATGAVIAALANERLLGTFDVDLDGDEELVTEVLARGAYALPQWGTIRVRTRSASGALSVSWELSQARAIYGVDRAEADREHYDNGSHLVGFDHDGDGQAHLLMLRRDGPGAASVRLSLLEFGANGAVASLAEASLSPLHDYGYLGDGQSEAVGAWFALNSSEGVAAIFDAGFSPIGEAAVFSGVSSIVAGDLGAGRSEVIFAGSGNNLVVADAAGANLLTPPVRRLERRGYGGSRFAMFDQDGDGRLELLWASSAEDGAPFVALLDRDGQPLWEVRLPEANQAPHASVSGDFVGDDSVDLAFLNGTVDLTAQVRVVNGATAAVNVRATPADAGRYPNQAIFRIDDVDGDGKDDLIVLHWVTWEVLSGRTLARIGTTHRLPASESAPRPSAQVQVDGDANLELFVNATHNGKAMVDPLTGATAWTVPATPSTAGQLLAQPGFADANADGYPDVAIPGIYADVTVYDGATGDVLQRYCLDGGVVRLLDAPATVETCTTPVGVSAISAADIDGDGRDEWLVGTAQGFLLAIDAPGAVLDWAVNFRTPVEAPTPVDIDRDGLLEVLVSTSNARIVMVDQAELSPPRVVREVAIDDADAIVDAGVDIDVSDRWNALGMAWAPVEGARRYLYTIVSENGNMVVPWTDAGDVTEVVRTGLNLVPGVRYVVQVIAFDEEVGASEVAVSDGVLITPGPPDILFLTATPDPFAPSRGEHTTLKAQATATPTTTLALWALTISSPDQALVATWTRSTDQRGLELLQDWSGLDSTEAPLPNGEYTVRLVVTDSNRNAREATTTVTIVSTDLGEDVGPPDIGEEVGADVGEDVAPEDVIEPPDVPDEPDTTVPPDVPDDVTESSANDVLPGADGFRADADNNGAYNLPDDTCCTCSAVGGRVEGPPLLALLALVGLLVATRLR